LAAIASEHAFSYLDVWVTDRAGHRADLALAVDVVERLDRFVAALWRRCPARHAGGHLGPRQPRGRDGDPATAARRCR
jgi:hypothetical protein